LYIEEAVERAQSGQAPSGLLQAYAEYRRLIAGLAYTIKFGTRGRDSLSDVVEEICTYVERTQVRSITILWQGDNVYHHIIEHYGDKYVGCAFNGILLPVEQPNTT